MRARSRRSAPVRLCTLAEIAVAGLWAAAVFLAALLAKLGKHTTGKGCLYIKKLADVDQKVLKDLIVKSVAAKRAARA